MLVLQIHIWTGRHTQ